MRIPVVLLASLTLAGCVTRTNAPSVRPTYLQSPEGEWQEVMIDYPPSTHFPHYRGGGIEIREVDRVRFRNNDQAEDFWRRRVFKRDSVDFTYVLHGPEGWRARASAEYVLESDVTPPSRVGRGDPDAAGRVVTRQEFLSVQRLVLTADTSRWWTLERRTAQLAPGMPYGGSTHRLLRGARELTVVPVSPNGPRSSPGPQSVLSPVATGWMIMDGELPLAVVQVRGGSLLGANDARAWIPSGIPAEERRERIAAALLLLVADQRTVFGREH